MKKFLWTALGGVAALAAILIFLFNPLKGYNKEFQQQLSDRQQAALAQQNADPTTTDSVETDSEATTEAADEEDNDFHQQMEADLEKLRSKVDDLLNDNTDFRAAVMVAQDKLNIKSNCEDKDWDCMLKEIMEAYSADPDPKLQRQIDTLIAERKKVQAELEKLRKQIQSTQQTTIQTNGDTSSEWMAVSPNLTTWFGTKVFRGGPDNDFYVEFRNPLNGKTIRVYREEGWRVMVNIRTGVVLNIDDKCVKRGQLAHNNGPFADAGCEDRDSHDPTDPNPGDGRTIEWHAALDCESMHALNTVWVEGINEAHVRIEQEGYNDIKLAVTGPYWANWTEVKTDKVTFTFYGTWQDGSRFEFREIRYCYRQPTPIPSVPPTATKVVPPSPTSPPTSVPPTATNGVPPTGVPPTATNGVPPSPTNPPTSVIPTATTKPSPTRDATATGQPPTPTKVPPSATPLPTPVGCVSHPPVHLDNIANGWAPSNEAPVVVGVPEGHVFIAVGYQLLNNGSEYVGGGCRMLVLLPGVHNLQCRECWVHPYRLDKCDPNGWIWNDLVPAEVSTQIDQHGCSVANYSTTRDRHNPDKVDTRDGEPGYLVPVTPYITVGRPACEYKQVPGTERFGSGTFLVGYEITLDMYPGMVFNNCSIANTPSAGWLTDGAHCPDPGEMRDPCVLP